MRKLEQLLMATIGAGLTLACASHPTKPALENNVEMLIKRSKESNAALMRGDIDTYKSLLTLSDDFTLMSPFGGEPTRGPLTNEAMQRMGKFFKHGTHDQELVRAYGTQDMVVLAIIERSRVEVGGLPSQEWALRVTLVYRRDGDDWTLVHRHADPLVERISLPYAATIARGERPEGG
jgi:ketosteroid isomerase-like protein